MKLRFSAIGALALFTLSSLSHAEDYQSFQFKVDSTSLKPVTAKADPTDAINVMAGQAAKMALSFREDASKRGAAEATIYQKVAAGTVLIATEDGLGSGAVLTNDGYIITNQHVVGDVQKVRVFFKPFGASNDMSRASETIGTVLKVNTQTDLALVKVDRLPSSVRPIPMKIDGPPAIGEDAHAVGHPRGEVWSYTRGYVSQYRTNYEWNTGKTDPSRAADVVQTQTPINPGNSGGPLVNGEGKLIGLNSFGNPTAPGLNFAVASSTIQKFLKQEGSYIEKVQSSPKTKTASANSNCGKGPIGETKGKWKSGPATLVYFDPDCKGRATAVKVIPVKTDEPISIFISDKESGDKTEIALIDFDRDGKIDLTLIDTDGDGNWDLAGDNKSGETVASNLKPIKKG